MLQKQVDFLFRVFGLDVSPFRTAKGSVLLRLYTDAVQLLPVIRKSVIPLEVVERWSAYFIQLSEYEFARLQPIVKFDHTWEPFYLLCVKMMTQIRINEQTETSLRTQQLYAVLEKGRINLRACGVVMCRKFPDSLTEHGKRLIKDGDLRVPHKNTLKSEKQA